MFVINPDPYLVPSYRISPFKTDDIANNNQLSQSNIIDIYFKERFRNKNYIYISNGREAINKALSFYNLKKNDVITILTTSNNFYISGCVTQEIEKICKWSREIVDTTKIIFVNHEFGASYKNLNDLKKYNLPIIEDCAHSFFSEDKNKTIGTVGDFVIYSFPKMFPIQIGGLLVTNIKEKIESDLDNETLNYVKKVLSHYIVQKDSIINKRIEIYKKIKKELSEYGFTERFELKEGIVPGVFMFNVNNEDLNLDKLKTYLWEHGIQCSIFYGERAFFIPVHQNLLEDDIIYFKEVIGSFLSSRQSDYRE